MTDAMEKKDSDVIPFEEGLNKAGFGLYSFLLTFLAGFGTIAYICVVYSTSIIVPSSACELETTTGQQGIMAAAPVVGSIIGNLIWGYLADTRGRRKMLLVALLVSAFLNAVASLSVNWIMLMILQFVISTFAAGVLPMMMSLLSESVPMKKRNFTVLIVMSMYLLAQGFMAALAIPIIPLNFSYHLPALGIYWNSWRTLVLLYSVPCIISAVCLFLMNESPKYLFVRGEEDSAVRVLKSIHRLNNFRSHEKFEATGFIKVGSEYLEEKLSTKDQIVPLFKKPLQKNTLTIITLMMLMQMSPFIIWLPTIANQFMQILQVGEVSGKTLCGIISTEIEAEPDTNPCALDVTSLIIVLCVGVLQSVINAIISCTSVVLAGMVDMTTCMAALCLPSDGVWLLYQVVDIVGRRNLVIVITAVCGISGILVNLVPNAIGSAVLFVVLIMGIILVGLYTSIVVALYPTHLRAFALAVPLSFSTMADFASIQIMNLLLVRNCEAGFYLFASTLTVSSVVALVFLPDERKLFTNEKSK